MTTLRTIALSFVGAALIAPSMAFAAPPPPPAAPAAKVDNMGCVIQLMWFVAEGRKVAADPSKSAEDQAKSYGFVEDMRGALGFFEARLMANPPADMKAAGTAAFDRMNKMSKDELVETTMACLDYFQTQEDALIGKMK